MKVIGVTGMPGSGKGVVSGIARRLGFSVIRMGDVVRAEAQKRNEDAGKVAVELRREYGEFVIAERCVKIIEKAESEKSKSKKNGNHLKNKDKTRMYLIEGIRSPFEVQIFNKSFKNFKLIAIHSTPKTRFTRLKRRMRADDSVEKSEFYKRDKRELDFGIGNVIATADYMVVNEGPIRKFKSIIRSILQNEM